MNNADVLAFSAIYNKEKNDLEDFMSFSKRHRNMLCFSDYAPLYMYVAFIDVSEGLAEPIIHDMGLDVLLIDCFGPTDREVQLVICRIPKKQLFIFGQAMQILDKNIKPLKRKTYENTVEMFTELKNAGGLCSVEDFTYALLNPPAV